MRIGGFTRLVGALLLAAALIAVDAGRSGVAGQTRGVAAPGMTAARPPDGAGSGTDRADGAGRLDRADQASQADRADQADRTDRVEYRIPVASAPVAIDGIMDDDAWADAVAIDLPYEVAPGDNAPSRVSTRCRLAYDEDHLYLGCVAEDPDPSSIRAYVADRDGISGHDRILLTLDPFNDQRRAFQFGISALGVQYDAVLAQQGAAGNQGPGSLPTDPSWDAIWHSAGTITESGFVVEAAIPFRSLRFPGGEDAGSWGAYLTRWWPRSSNVEMRSTAWDRDNGCVLCQADLVTGLRDLSPGMNVELTPTLTGSKAAERGGADDAPLVARPADGEIGLDARWGVTSDLTLNLAVNPDFSQVEADVAQLDVNNRFALFFPEKRPFFLEGADFFGTPIRAVFTRSIVEPVAGAKLTGKLGASALGLLVARDRATNLLLPGSQSSVTEVVDAPVTTAIARFRRDVGGSSTVGALATAREGAGYHNRVGGMDAYYRPVAALTLQGQVLGSVTRYPASVVAARGTPADAFTGYAASGSAQWSTRAWLVYAEGRVLDDGFRADAGFQAQAGVRGGSLNVTRRIWGGADRWFTQLRLEGGTWHNEDFDGNPLGRGMWVGLGYDGPGQISVGLWPNLFMSEHFDGVTYDGMNQLWFDLRAAPRGSLSFGLNGNLGDAIDFANGRPGSELRLAPVVDVRLGRNVEGGLRHTYQRLTVDGAPVFTANLSQLRVVYNFSPRSFVRAIVQYRRTDRDPLLFADPVDRRSVAVLGQGLFAYKVNPQTVLFLGYGEDGNGSIGSDNGRVPFETRARALFLKVGYAWRP